MEEEGQRSESALGRVLLRYTISVTGSIPVLSSRDSSVGRAIFPHHPLVCCRSPPSLFFFLIVLVRGRSRMDLFRLEREEKEDSSFVYTTL